MKIKLTIELSGESDFWQDLAKQSFAIEGEVPAHFATEQRFLAGILCRAIRAIDPIRMAELLALVVSDLLDEKCASDTVEAEFFSSAHKVQSFWLERDKEISDAVKKKRASP